MRSAWLLLLGVAVGSATGVALAVFGVFGGRGDADADGSVRAELAAQRGELRRLSDQLAALERTCDELRRVEPSREAVASSPHLPDVASLPHAPTLNGGAAATAALDPRQLLAEYVASFDGGGTGSDFFRMAVAAYAWPLRAELQAIVVDRKAPEPLRLQVMAMFTGGSFRGDGATIDALLEILRAGGWESGVTEALNVLAKIGDRRTADLIEGVASSLEPLKLRVAAWAAIAQLCGGNADAVLLRLFERERDPEGRVQLLALFRGADLVAALRAYDLASKMEKSVRLDAAGRIGRFRDERFVALTQEWYGREPDEQVRERLAAALERQKQVPGWHELQACGPPNVANPSSDDQRAWAAAQADGGREWIELTYDKALVADRVTIHETSVPGGVTSVEVLEEGGAWRTVWSGEDPTTVCGPFEVRFAATRAPVKKVRVNLETSRRKGWEEIDAVELAGPDGSAWAAQAAASSRYGEGSATSTFDDSDGGALPLFGDQFKRTLTLPKSRGR
jgi:hypothetical protein